MTGRRGPLATQRRTRTWLAATALALAASVLVPLAAAAHPLGNFTINHYAGIRLTGSGVDLDVVIDLAEIPAFQERQRIDANRDGEVSAAEAEAERLAACPILAGSIRLAVGGTGVPLEPVAAGLSFPTGAGGLPTMRLVCELRGATGGPIPAGTEVEVRDDSYAERIGWREIVLVASGVAGMGGGLAERLTRYPADPLVQPPAVRSLTVAAGPAVLSTSAWSAPDAQPLSKTEVSGQPSSAPSGSAGPAAAAVESPGARTTITASALPAGLEGDLASIIGRGDLTPLAVAASLLVAALLGAIHALSPGHGKTIMAAYLVGRRGSLRHAVGLGLSVAVSHTIGVLALAMITLLAADVLPPERLYPILGVASGSLVAAIGGSLLLARLREVWRGRSKANGHHHHAADHHAADHHAADHHAPTREAGQAASAGTVVYYPDGSHSHGGGRPHRHLPDERNGLSWRALFLLGLSGGLVPSASALILLLGSVATGRVAYGIVLVLGFGAGMAVVLGGVGLLVVKASSLLERVPSAPRIARLSALVQTATACLVVVLGLVLAGQALGQVV